MTDLRYRNGKSHLSDVTAAEAALNIARLRKRLIASRRNGDPVQATSDLKMLLDGWVAIGKHLGARQRQYRPRHPCARATQEG